ncbi:tyrosine-type recombinase/integrase [Micromonospora sp. HUAS LYJ1]|uniref:tyrosine-type recombinase/integrase n=1 Tax=Micromonospora sp. HUAS LYJ1 TaxID=3061626 RepID=UPI0034A02164
MFFVRPDGRPWHPSGVTQRFRRLVRQAGLPPTRLHDLRHSAATIALAAGVDIKVVSEQLGHSTTTLTRDTYQSVTRAMHHDAADAVAEKIRRHRPRTACPSACRCRRSPPARLACAAWSPVRPLVVPPGGGLRRHRNCRRRRTCPPPGT